LIENNKNQIKNIINNSKIKNSFEEELLEILEEYLKNGDILIFEDGKDVCNDILAKFSFSGSKIDWRKVPGSICENSTCRESEINDWMVFFEKIFTEYQLEESEWIFYINDNAFSFILVIKTKVLKGILPKLLEFPMHHYVYDYNGRWIISFTHEGDMAFGFSEK